MLNDVIRNSYMRNTLRYLSNFLPNLRNWHANTLLHTRNSYMRNTRVHLPNFLPNLRHWHANTLFHTRNSYLRNTRGHLLTFLPNLRTWHMNTFLHNFRYRNNHLILDPLGNTLLAHDLYGLLDSSMILRTSTSTTCSTVRCCPRL